MAKTVSSSNTTGKVPFLVDTSETLKTFFQYNGKCCNVGKLVVGAVMGSGDTSEDISDKMRQNYVQSAKMGEQCVYYLGAAVPSKFKEFVFPGEKQKFDPEIIFDMSKNRKRDHFAKIVHDMEDVDLMGNREIWPDEGMGMAVLVDSPDLDTVEERVNEFKAHVPTFDEQFEVVVVVKDE
jgi:hypothetical protein